MRAAVRSLLRPVLMVAAATLLIVLPTSAAGAADVDDPLAGWSPPTGWTLTSQVVSTAAQRGACESGMVRVFTDQRQHPVTLEVVDCSGPAQADAWVHSIWAATARPSVPITAAFGTASELGDATEMQVQREWAQGRYGLEAVAPCAGLTKSACAAESLAWARSARAALSGSNQLGTLTSALSGGLQGWAPDTAGYWRLGVTVPIHYYCPGTASSTWVGANAESLTVMSGDCGTAQETLRADREFWNRTSGTGFSRLPTTAEGAVRSGWSKAQDGKTAPLSRAWVQGGRLTAVVLTCGSATRANCDAYSRQYVNQLSSLLRPAPLVPDGIDRKLVDDFFSIALIAPVTTFLLLVVPVRFWGWVRERGWRAAAAPRFRPVDRVARRARVLRDARRWIVFGVALACWVPAVSWSTGNLGYWALAVAFFGPFIIGSAIAGGIGLLWKAPLLVRPPRARSAGGRRRLLAIACRGSAYLLLVVALTSYMIGYLLSSADQDLAAMTVRTRVDAGLKSGEPVAIALALLSSFLGWARDSNAFLLLFAVTLLVPVTLALLLDRFGRRLQRQDLAATLSADSRPYFLYLRGFEEDQLRVREVAGRVGLLEILAPFSRPRFEEVLVERLGHFGPVIAIASHRNRVADLGAAKASFADDQWRDRVAEYAGGARAVVISATPGRVSDGLGWEIRHLADHHPELTLLLVVAPWPRPDLIRRWQAFLDYAGEYTPFDGIRPLELPDGVQVLTWTTTAGWRSYGARRRWDWTYAASIVEAVRDLEPSSATPTTTAPDLVGAS